MLVSLVALVFCVGCGCAGSAEGQVGGKTSGSANIANPMTK